MGEVAIVTGGASGIGAALGAALVRRGAHVVLADVNGAGARLNAERFTELGPGAASSALVDVRDGQAVADLVNETHQRHGRLDLMFNNAGIGMGGEPDELLLDHWDRMLDVALRGVLHGCRAAYPLMKQQGSGQIVNTASLAGLIPSPGWMAPYAMAKFGVVGLSLALRAAGADFGVHVNVVCPGFVDTPILDTKGPEDLPVPASVADLSLRDWLREHNVPLYPPDRLAEDVLRGIARDRAVIVAPRSARATWVTWRLAPAALLRSSARLSRMTHPRPRREASAADR